MVKINSKANLQRCAAFCFIVSITIIVATSFIDYNYLPYLIIPLIMSCCLFVKSYDKANKIEAEEFEYNMEIMALKINRYYKLSYYTQMVNQLNRNIDDNLKLPYELIAEIARLSCGIGPLHKLDHIVIKDNLGKPEIDRQKKDFAAKILAARKELIKLHEV